MDKHESCASHCCKRHGCKYGYEDSPVVNGEVPQEYSCQTGFDFGQDCFENPPNPEIILKEEVEKILGGVKFEHNVTHQGILNAMKRYGQELLQYND